MTERVGMEITVDARQAQAEINKTRTAATSLGGTLEKLDRVSLTAAKGIGALGPALGAASRSSSELLRGVGDVAGLLGSGGVFGVAIGVAALGVAKLSEKWMESGKAAEKATEDAVRAARSIADAIEQSIADMELAATKAETGIQDTGEARARMLRVELSGLNYEIGQLERTAPQGVIGKFFSDSDNKLDDAKKKAAALKVELEKIDALLGARASVALRAPKTGEPPNKGGRVGGRAIPNEPEAAAIGYGDDTALPAGAWVYNGPSAEALADLESARTEVIKTETEQRLRIAEDAHRQMLAMEAERQLAADETAAVVTNGVISVITMSAQLAVADAKGHKAMMAQMLGATVSAAGGFITMKGGEALAAGLSRAFISSGTDPGAYAAIAGGTALILAGQAVQQGGPAAINGLMGVNGSASGGGRGGGVSTGERGFGRRSRQSSGSSGTSDKPAQIVNVWGVDGPQAEDQARRTVRSNRLARRRGFA